MFLAKFSEPKKPKPQRQNHEPLETGLTLRAPLVLGLALLWLWLLWLLLVWTSLDHLPPDPSLGPPSVGPLQNFAFFSLSRHHYALFFLGVFSLNFGGVLEGRGPEMCTFGFISGLTLRDPTLRDPTLRGSTLLHPVIRGPTLRGPEKCLFFYAFFHLVFLFPFSKKKAKILKHKFWPKSVNSG